MGIYSPEVVEILKQSPYRENVSDHVIQYGDAFKQEFYCLSQQGHKPKDIFLSLGLDPALLGSNVIRSFVRSMKDFQPKLNQAGQPISITRSLIEKDEEIEKLKFEVKFLKKKEAHRLGNVSEREAKRHYFRLIQETFESPTNTWTIEALCRFCGVSKSGYYRWKKITQVNIEKREREDQVAFSLILEAFNYRQKPKGQRQILMHLAHNRTPMCRSKIRRLMKKFNLVCPIRKPRFQRQVSAEYQAEHVKPNYVKREFRAYGPRSVLLTDITYLPYGRQKWAYLATVKDAFTNEILSYKLSPMLHIAFVLKMIRQLIAQHPVSLATQTLIHSDQGSHFTSVKFQYLVENNGLIQSMSRRGNCWDNAPQESFYGHMKDEIDLASCEDYEDVKKLIEEYMDYYNNERYQWNLAKLSPIQYYQFCTTNVYPLADIYSTPALPHIRTIEIEE